MREGARERARERAREEGVEGGSRWGTNEKAKLLVGGLRKESTEYKGEMRENARIGTLG